MSSAPLADAELPAQVATARAHDERTSSSSWPRTRLMSFVCTLGLALALASPLPFAGVPDAVLALTLVPLALATYAVRWSFDSRALRSRGRVSIAVVAATIPAAAAGVCIVTAVWAVLGIAVAPGPVALSLLLTTAVACVAAAARAVELRVRRASRMVYLAGSEEQRRDLQRQALRHGDMRIVGFTRIDDGARARAPAQLAARVADAGATTLVLSAGAIRDETICAAASLCNVQGRRVRTLSGFYEEQFKRIPLSELTPSWFLFDIAEIHRPRLYAASKRAFESVLAGLLLALLAPILLLTAAAVALSSRGPVLFRQLRVGRGGDPFTIVKFRTMRPAEGAAPAAWANADGARITGTGRWLRRFRLDELPQLWNVLLGQLSLIGPRPEQIGIVRDLEEQIPFYAARHVVRPGLTGWAQVSCGYGGSLRGALEKLQLDLYYVKHQSLRLDLLILASTLRAVLRRHDDVSDPQPVAAGA